MRPSHHYFLGLLSLGALASCSNDLDFEQLLPKPKQEKAITFSVAEWQHEGQTRTAYSKNEKGISVQWTAGDAIGVFPFLDDHDNTPASRNQIDFLISEGTASASTCLFDGGSWSLRGGWSYWAYYPYSVDNYNNYQSGDPERRISFDYYGTLTQVGNGNIDHIAAYDYMVALPKKVSDNGSIDFEMKHMSAILQLELKFPEGTAINVNSVILKKTICNDSFHDSYSFIIEPDGSHRTEGYWGESVVLNLKNAITQGNSLTANFIIAPTTSGDETWEVTVATESNLYKGTFEPNVSSVEAGNIYKFTCNVASATADDVHLGNNMLGIEDNLFAFSPTETAYYMFAFDYDSNYNMNSIGADGICLNDYDNKRRTAYLLEADKKYYFSAYANYPGHSVDIEKVANIGSGSVESLPEGAVRTFIPESDGNYSLSIRNGWAYWKFPENEVPNSFFSDAYALKAGKPYLICAEEESDVLINQILELEFGKSYTIPAGGGSGYFTIPAFKWIGIDSNTGFVWMSSPEGSEICSDFICSPIEGIVNVEFIESTSPINVTLSEVPTIQMGSYTFDDIDSYRQFIVPEDGYYYAECYNGYSYPYTLSSMSICLHGLYRFQKDAPVLINIGLYPEAENATLTVGRYDVLKEGASNVEAGKRYVFVADETDYYKVDGNGSISDYQAETMLDYVRCVEGEAYQVYCYNSGSINIVRYRENTIQLNETITEDGLYSFTPSQSGFYMAEDYSGWSCNKAENNEWIGGYTWDIRYLEAGVKYSIQINNLAEWSMSGNTRIIKLVENDYQLQTPGESLNLSTTNGQFQIVTYTPQSGGSYRCVVADSESYIYWIRYNDPEIYSDVVAKLEGGTQYACVVRIENNTTMAITSASVNNLTAVLDQEYTLSPGSVTNVTFTAPTSEYYWISSPNYSFTWTDRGPYVWLEVGETVNFSCENTTGSDVKFTVVNPIEIGSWSPTASRGVYYFTPTSNGTYQFRVTNGDESTGGYFSIINTMLGDWFGHSVDNIGTNPVQLIPMVANTKYLLYFDIWGPDVPEIRIELEN